MSIFGRLKSKKDKVQINADNKQISADEKNATVNRRISQQQSAHLVKQAWVTERAGDLTKDGKYIFIVDGKATKSEIKKAIGAIYNVHVIQVNVINTKGKTKRLGRNMGRTSRARKAIVTLKKGQKIDIMPT